MDPKARKMDATYDPADDGEDEAESPQQTRNLVPLAERPFAPPDNTETARETVWFNSTDVPIQLDVYVGHPAVLPNPKRLGRPLTWEERTAKRRYVIKPKQERAIPAEFDAEIQRFQCMDTDCSQNPFGCKNSEHRWMIVGGLCPQGLVRRGLQVRPILAPGLDDLKAREDAEKQATIDRLVRRDQDDRELLKLREELASTKSQLAKRDAELEAATAPTKTAPTTKK